MKVSLIILSLNLLLSCQQSNSIAPTIKNPNAMVTFIELGSDKCLPCLNMRPIMKSLEEK